MSTFISKMRWPNKLNKISLNWSKLQIGVSFSCFDVEVFVVFPISTPASFPSLGHKIFNRKMLSWRWNVSLRTKRIPIAMVASKWWVERKESYFVVSSWLNDATLAFSVKIVRPFFLASYLSSISSTLLWRAHNFTKTIYSASEAEILSIRLFALTVIFHGIAYILTLAVATVLCRLYGPTLCLILVVAE